MLVNFIRFDNPVILFQKEFENINHLILMAKIKTEVSIYFENGQSTIHGVIYDVEVSYRLSLIGELEAETLSVIIK